MTEVELNLWAAAIVMRMRFKLGEGAEPGVGYVYFVTAGRKAIKIGSAKNPEWRLSALQNANHEELKIIAACYGSPRLERAIHEKFKNHHIRGEWFRYNKPILAFAALAAAENTPMPVQTDEPDE